MSGFSRDPATLHPYALSLYTLWQERVRAAGIEPLAYCFARSAEEQARLFRFNRPWAEIELAHVRLRRLGLTEEATTLLTVGPQGGKGGPKKTNAPPGLSFHQMQLLDGGRGALAWDWVPLCDGKPGWEEAALYRKGGEIAEALGLTWSGRWRKFKEMPHIQFDRLRELSIEQLAKGVYA
jgi:hypothetical protein